MTPSQHPQQQHQQMLSQINMATAHVSNANLSPYLLPYMQNSSTMMQAVAGLGHISATINSAPGANNSMGSASRSTISGSMAPPSIQYVHTHPQFVNQPYGFNPSDGGGASNSIGKSTSPLDSTISPSSTINQDFYPSLIPGQSTCLLSMHQNFYQPYAQSHRNDVCINFVLNEDSSANHHPLTLDHRTLLSTGDEIFTDAYDTSPSSLLSNNFQLTSCDQSHYDGTTNEDEFEYSKNLTESTNVDEMAIMYSSSSSANSHESISVKNSAFPDCDVSIFDKEFYNQTRLSIDSLAITQTSPASTESWSCDEDLFIDESFS